MPDAMKDFGVDLPGSTREFWVGQGLPLTAREFWVFLGFVVVVPLSCLRTLDALKFTSTAALAFVLFIVVFVLLFAIDSPRLDDFDPCPTASNEPAPDCRGEFGYLYTSPIRTLKVFSIFIFAFTCQQVRRFAPIVYRFIGVCQFFDPRLISHSHTTDTNGPDRSSLHSSPRPPDRACRMSFKSALR